MKADLDVQVAAPVDTTECADKRNELPIAESAASKAKEAAPVFNESSGTSGQYAPPKVFPNEKHQGESFTESSADQVTRDEPHQVSGCVAVFGACGGISFEQDPRSSAGLITQNHSKPTHAISKQDDPICKKPRKEGVTERFGIHATEDGKAKEMHSRLFATHPDPGASKVLPNAEPNPQDNHQAVPSGQHQSGMRDEIPSQELIDAALKGEVHDDLRLISLIPKHPVIVFRDEFDFPDLLQIDKQATVGSITVADERVGSMQQPVAVSNCLGSPVKLSDVTTPYQQIFLRELRVYEPGVQGVAPPFLESLVPCTRIQVLRNQEAWVAVDEMNHYLQMIASTDQIHVTPACVISSDVEEDQLEKVLHEWFRQALPDRDPHSKSITALLVQGHWFPVVVTPQHGKVTVQTTSAGHSWIDVAIRSQGIEYSIEPVSFPLVTRFNNDCGFQTVAWLMDSIVASDFGEPLHCVPPVEVSTAVAWRGSFEHHLILNSLDHEQVIPAELQFGGAIQVCSAVVEPNLDHRTNQVSYDKPSQLTFRKFWPLVVLIGAVIMMGCLVQSRFWTLVGFSWTMSVSALPGACGFQNHEKCTNHPSIAQPSTWRDSQKGALPIKFAVNLPCDSPLGGCELIDSDVGWACHQGFPTSVQLGSNLTPCVGGYPHVNAVDFTDANEMLLGAIANLQTFSVDEYTHALPNPLSCHAWLHIRCTRPLPCVSD